MFTVKVSFHVVYIILMFSMNSILNSTDFFELQYLLNCFIAKLNEFRPQCPSEQNLWWRRPLEIEGNMCNSFHSIQLRHARRDKHWAQYAGPYDQRNHYMFNLGRNDDVKSGVKQNEQTEYVEIQGQHAVLERQCGELGGVW
jgi:hypothetical protein